MADCQPSLILAYGFLQQLKQLKWLKLASKAPLVKHVLQHYWQKNLSLTQWDFESVAWLATDTLPLAQGKLWQKPEITEDKLAFLQYPLDPQGIQRG